MIPHKSRLYRCILDLSFDINFNNIKTIKNVNSTTNKLAPQKSMANLGSVLEHFVQVLAKHEHLKLPFAFCKIDIKDGFWRMVVSAVNSWNFCYTIPPPKDANWRHRNSSSWKFANGLDREPTLLRSSNQNSAGYHPVASNVANSITTTPTRTSHMSTSTRNVTWHRPRLQQQKNGSWRARTWHNWSHQSIRRWLYHRYKRHQQHLLTAPRKSSATWSTFHLPPSTYFKTFRRRPSFYQKTVQWRGSIFIHKRNTRLDV